MRACARYNYNYYNYNQQRYVSLMRRTVLVCPLTRRDARRRGCGEVSRPGFTRSQRQRRRGAGVACQQELIAPDVHGVVMCPNHVLGSVLHPRTGDPT